MGTWRGFARPFGNNATCRNFQSYAKRPHCRKTTSPTYDNAQQNYNYTAFNRYCLARCNRSFLPFRNHIAKRLQLVATLHLRYTHKRYCRHRLFLYLVEKDTHFRINLNTYMVNRFMHYVNRKFACKPTANMAHFSCRGSCANTCNTVVLN